MQFGPYQVLRHYIYDEGHIYMDSSVFVDNHLHQVLGEFKSSLQSFVRSSHLRQVSSRVWLGCIPHSWWLAERRPWWKKQNNLAWAAVQLIPTKLLLVEDDEVWRLIIETMDQFSFKQVSRLPMQLEQIGLSLVAERNVFVVKTAFGGLLANWLTNSYVVDLVSSHVLLWSVTFPLSYCLMFNRH